jgi:signal transduction histidine kinase
VSTALENLIDATSVALSCDALLVADRGPDGTLTAAATRGLSAGTADLLLAGLAGADTGRLRQGPLALRDLAPDAADGLADLDLLGAFCAATEADVASPGVLCALRHGADEPPDADVLVAFARHAGVALAHRTAPALLPGVAAGDDAFDGLALSTRNFEELTHAVGRVVQEILDVPLTAIMAYDEDRGVLQMTPGSFGAGDATTASYQIAVTNLRSNAARVFATGQPYLSNDAPGDPGIRPGYVRAFGIQRLLSVPLRLGQRPTGVLHLANKATDFTAEDLVRAQALAARIATVVEIARTSFRLDREQRLQRVLSGIAVAIARGDGLQDFLSPALRELCDAAGASFIALVPERAAPVFCRGQHERPDLEQQLIEEARTQPPASAKVAAPEAIGDPGWAKLHVPIELQGHRVGTLSALRTRGEPFATDEQHAIARLAQLAALAWATERYQQQRARLARLEERRGISEELHDDVRRILFDAQQELDTVIDAGALDEDAAAEVARARGLVIRGYSAIRAAVHHVERPAAHDLPQRLRAVVSAAQEEFPVQVRLELPPPACDRARALPDPAADALVKVAREALVNAAKHGGPCQVTVSLEARAHDQLRLVVEDDGPGMAARARSTHHGLGFLRRLVRDHGGQLQVRAGTAGRGTRVVATLPVVAEARSPA